jgi:hypothetical protein
MREGALLVVVALLVIATIAVANQSLGSIELSAPAVLVLLATVVIAGWVVVDLATGLPEGAVV